MKNLPNSDLLELLLETSLLVPDRTTSISSWHRHIPFAFALMRIMRPRVFVELGTHRGDSYSAFCQARQHFQLETECSAVDTWEGDSQAGYYGDEVFSELRKSHDPSYGEFSQLLRMRFEQALPLFPDGGIDLLHIDGLHTYEAVKEDYESWLPKMSEAGVILFHDTNVLNRDDFGVWRLWQELTPSKPNFEFKFGYGLGVLATGEKVSKLVLDFLRWASVAPELVDRFFWLQGSDIEARQLPAIADKRDQLGVALGYAQSIVAERDTHLEAVNSALEKTGEQLGVTQSIVAERDAQLEAVNSALEKTAEQLGDVQSMVIERDARLEALNSSLEETREQLGTLQTSVLERDAQLEVLNNALSQSDASFQRIVGSRWWRVRNKIFSILGRKDKIFTFNHSNSESEEKLVVANYSQEEWRTHDLQASGLGELPVVMMISHGRGGGCARHIRELAHRLTSKALVLLLQTAERNGKLATLTLVRAPEPNRTVMFNQNSDSTDVVEILKLVGVRLIHYHHTVDLPEWLLSLPNYLDAPFYFTAHDQFMVCPQITMTTPNGAFCGEPAESDCDTCLALTPTRYATKIVTWRQKNRDWLRRAESVYVPSHDSRLRFERYFPEISAKVSPPQTNALPKGTLQRVLADSETLKIVVVGAISIEKGADRLERIAKKVAALKLPFVFHLVGYSYRELEVQPNSNLYVHGEYQDHELELLLQELAPDLAWFPGQCPETFSYTLSSCAGFGLPILAPNIGAFPERLANRAMSWVEPVGQSDYDTLETLISIRKLLLSGDAWVISSDSTKRSDGPIDTNLYFDQLSRASAPFDEALLQSIDHRLAAISRSSPCEEVAQK